MKLVLMLFKFMKLALFIFDSIFQIYLFVQIKDMLVLVVPIFNLVKLLYSFVLGFGLDCLAQLH